MKNIMEQMCIALKGHNFIETNTGYLFDFWSQRDDAILTMCCHKGEIKILEDVEYYGNSTGYEYISLEKYEKKLNEVW